MISPSKNSLFKMPLIMSVMAAVAGVAAAKEPLSGAIVAPPDPAATIQKRSKVPAPHRFAAKQRIFVLTDIGNEPDDQMSLVRLLVYANDLDIEGIAAVTSTWLKTKTNPDTLHKLIDAYGVVLPNLKKHADAWPAAAALHKTVSSGPNGYGLAAVNTMEPSAAARALIAAADRDDGRPLWVSVWGGANVLAEALEVVRRTRSDDALDAFVEKLRVYSISDQDDAGPWIRREFPRLQYIVSPSLPNNDEYAAATWAGISGDIFYANGAGADQTTITNDWLETHIRKGALGTLYPKFKYIMEGDTPAFLGLIPNGLNSAMSPAWGGWGGRYVYRQPYGETRAIWTQGGGLLYGVNSRDRVLGGDRQEHVSDQATIWRWRNAFQNDFAARMDWTIKPKAAANHRPLAVINGDRSGAPLSVELQAGASLLLDASESEDPDRGQTLHYRWFSYPEAGATLGKALGDVNIDGADSARATISAASICRPLLPDLQIPCKSGIAHVILEVTDDGEPQLTSYRRVIVDIKQ